MSVRSLALYLSCLVSAHLRECALDYEALLAPDSALSSNVPF